MKTVVGPLIKIWGDIQMLLPVKDMGKQAESVVALLQKNLTTLEQKSDTALDTFRKTAAELDDINRQIDVTINVADQQIASLTALRGDLLSKKSSNERVKGKIEDFLA
jgi:vacuolar-type H+-ATPase subunit D/Vma8